MHRIGHSQAVNESTRLDVFVYAPTFGTLLVEELAQTVAPALRALAPTTPQTVPGMPFWQDVIVGC